MLIDCSAGDFGSGGETTAQIGMAVLIAGSLLGFFAVKKPGCIRWTVMPIALLVFWIGLRFLLYSFGYFCIESSPLPNTARSELAFIARHTSWLSWEQPTMRMSKFLPPSISANNQFLPLILHAYATRRIDCRVHSGCPVAWPPNPSGPAAHRL